MIDIRTLIKEAKDFGFSQAGGLKIEALEFMPEVRDMCAADLCRSYGKNWTCPPACGTLEEISKEASKYSTGILVQTIGELEDDFDWECMEQTSKKHKENFDKFTEVLRKKYPDLLAMGAGSCGICEECTYPDEPCLFPERANPSMEAYGLFVSKVCTLSNMLYNNGPRTITYTSCYLIE